MTVVVDLSSLGPLRPINVFVRSPIVFYFLNINFRLKKYHFTSKEVLINGSHE